MIDCHVRLCEHARNGALDRLAGLAALRVQLDTYWRQVRRLQAARAQHARRPIAETVFEARVGGHIVDRATDGSECRWARILAFDAPDRVVFSWDISPQWAIETAPAQASEVEVRFYAESPNRRRVEPERRHIDWHHAGGEAVGDGIDGPEGWTLYLNRFAALLAGGR
jgi:uncharacterized protein YndB with AHSA1/START domain